MDGVVSESDQQLIGNAMDGYTVLDSCFSVDLTGICCSRIVSQDQTPHRFASIPYFCGEISYESIRFDVGSLNSQSIQVKSCHEQLTMTGGTQRHHRDIY
jgi:hypothetical protein